MKRIPSIHPLHIPRRAKQTGTAIVEFALVALFFFTLLIGTMEFGRWIFTLNAANEATRLGARLAVVCSISDANRITLKMHQMANGIPQSAMKVDYQPEGCNEGTCKTVTAWISGATFSPLIPLMGADYSIPEFSTSLPRELMDSSGNPVCQ